MTVVPVYRPYVFLRCKSCGGKTDHVLIEINFHSEDGKREEIFECQACGEMKRIYEFAASNVYGSVQPEMAKKVEKDQEKDSKEATASAAAASQQPEEQSEGQNEKNKAVFLNSSLDSN